jgi:hypothetical protein
VPQLVSLKTQNRGLKLVPLKPETAERKKIKRTALQTQKHLTETLKQLIKDCEYTTMQIHNAHYVISA